MKRSSGLCFISVEVFFVFFLVGGGKGFEANLEFNVFYFFLARGLYLFG